MIIREQKVRLIDKDMSFLGKLKYITKFIGNAFFVACLLCIFLVALLTVIYVGDRFINSNRKPIFGAYIIISPSMVPTLMVNDGIIVKRQNDFVIGDIITFDSEDERFKGLNITHRIVRKEQLDDGSYVFKTKGDNNKVEDPATVSINNIYGKTILKIPKIGYIKNYLLNPIVLTMALIVPLLIIIYTNFLVPKKEIELLQ